MCAASIRRLQFQTPRGADRGHLHDRDTPGDTGCAPPDDLMSEDVALCGFCTCVGGGVLRGASGSAWRRGLEAGPPSSPPPRAPPPPMLPAPRQGPRRTLHM